MKILYTSDLHGEIPLYQQLLELARDSSSEILLLGGDLLPTFRQDGGYEEMISHQEKFVTQFLLPFFKDCRETTAVVETLLIPGNWDVGYSFVPSSPTEGVVDLTQRRYCTRGYEFIGYPFVPPTPFRPKDYEKMDDREAPWPPQKTPSYIYSPQHNRPLQPIDPYLYLRRRGTIAEDLELLPAPENPSRAIYVMHSPPFGTRLDLIQGGMHVGSRSIRAFIEKRQPLLTLHGHIHEAPEISGAFFDHIGRTLAINPGQSLWKGSRLAKLYAVTLEMEDPENTLWHSCLAWKA